MHSQISKQLEYNIKIILKKSNQGWTTKHMELIVEKSEKEYPNTLINHTLWKFALDRGLQERYTLTPNLRKQRRISKKIQQILVMTQC